MKASLKFRETQKPLFRAKLPFNFLGFPFQSGIVAGESKELSLNLTTSLESGPSLKVAYRPNDSFNPFSLVFETATRHFGSPICSSFNIRAELNLIRSGENPSFFLHFNPHFGDVILDLSKNNYNSQSESESESPAAGMVLSDVEMIATMAVPLRKTATLNFLLSVRVPVMLVLMNNSMTGILLQKLPCLIVNKIGFDCRVRPASIDVAEVFLGVKKQLEMMKVENGALKKAMDNFKCEFFNGLEINVTSKKALDYLKDEFITDRVFRFPGSTILDTTRTGYANKRVWVDLKQVEVINRLTSATRILNGSCSG